MSTTAEHLANGARNAGSRIDEGMRRKSSQLGKFFDDVEELLRRVSTMEDADISRLRNRVESSIEHVKDRAGHDRRYAINFDKIRNELGWEPSVSLENGLAKTVAWFKENEAWWRCVKSGEYQAYYEKH